MMIALTAAVVWQEGPETPTAGKDGTQKPCLAEEADHYLNNLPHASIVLLHLTPLFGQRVLVEIQGEHFRKIQLLRRDQFHLAEQPMATLP